MSSAFLSEMLKQQEYSTTIRRYKSITVRGKGTAVVLSIEEYGRLNRHEDSLLEFFCKSPLRGVDLDLTRDQDRGRDIEL